MCKDISGESRDKDSGQKCVKMPIGDDLHVYIEMVMITIDDHLLKYAS